MTILTQGNGVVSCFAIHVVRPLSPFPFHPTSSYPNTNEQVAAASAAIVISTSSSDTKLKLSKKLGAMHTINYVTTPNWEAEVLRLTNGKGVDNVVEIGCSATIERSLACTRQGGLASLVVFLGGGKKSDLVHTLLLGGRLASRFFRSLLWGR